MAVRLDNIQDVILAQPNPPNFNPPNTVHRFLEPSAKFNSHQFLQPYGSSHRLAKWDPQAHTVEGLVSSSYSDLPTRNSLVMLLREYINIQEPHSQGQGWVKPHVA